MLYRSIKPLVVDAVQVEEATDVRTNGGLVHAERGDWLLMDPQGNLVRFSDADFKCTFDPLRDSTPIELLREGRPCGC
jgi:hypothetical protein